MHTIVDAHAVFQSGNALSIRDTYNTLNHSTHLISFTLRSELHPSPSSLSGPYGVGSVSFRTIIGNSVRTYSVQRLWRCVSRCGRNTTSGCMEVVSTWWMYSQGSRAAQPSSLSMLAPFGRDRARSGLESTILTLINSRPCPRSCPCL